MFEKWSTEEKIFEAQATRTTFCHNMLQSLPPEENRETITAATLSFI
jgi:hypothetical protein